VARALLLALLLTVALAAVCEVVTYSGGESIVPLVYSEKGYTPFTNINILPQKPLPLEQNRMIFVEGGGRVHEVGVGNTAVEPQEGLFTTTSMEGPFLFVYKVNDTIRIARDVPENPTWDGRRRERYEGRFEAGGVRGFYSIGAVAKRVAKSMLGLGEGGRAIKNYFVADDFDVGVTCASTACRKEIYSLLTKYMNIGASGEMVAEALHYTFGFAFRGALQGLKKGGKVLGVVGRKLGGEKLRKQVIEKLDNIIKRLKGLKKFTSKDAEAILDKMDDEKKKLAESVFMGERVSAQFSRDELLALYVKLSELKEGLEAVPRCLSDMREQLASLEEGRAREILNKILGDLEEARSGLESVKNLHNRLSGLENYQGEVPDHLRSILEGVDQAIDDIRALEEELSPLKGGRPEEIMEKLRQLSICMNSEFPAGGNCERVRRFMDFVNTRERSFARLSSVYSARLEEIEHMSPLLISQYALLTDAAHSFMGEKERLIYHTSKSLFAGGILSPALFYISRRGIGYLTSALGKTNFNIETLGNYGFPVTDSYSLPPEWSHLKIQPLKDRDAMVDIIINGGSDPGDAFKAYMSLLPLGLFNSLVKKYTGHDVAGSLGLVESEEERRMRDVGPALVALSTDPTCNTCRAAATSNKFYVFSPRRLSLAVTEDSKEGSTAILFFKRSNLLGPEGPIITMNDSERSCLKKCPFMRFVMSNRVVKYILADPVKNMFFTSLFFGYIVPIFAGGGLGAFMVQPAIGSFLYGGCQTCVDDVFGYYLHVRAPKLEENTTLSDAFAEGLRSLGLDVNVEDMLLKMRKEEAEKKQVMVYVNLNKASGVLEGKLVAEAARPTKALPVEERTSTLVLEGEGGQIILEGNNMLTPKQGVQINPKSVRSLGTPLSVTTDKGTFSGPVDILPNGKVIVNGEEKGTLKRAVFKEGVVVYRDGKFYFMRSGEKSLPASLAVPDTDIPGIIIPSVLVRSRPQSHIILEVRGPEDFALDTSLEDCLKENNITSGVVKQIIMDNGVIDIGDRIRVASDKWSGEASLVKVYSNGDVVALGKTVVSDDNGLKIKYKEIKVGKVKSVVFDNLALMKKGNDIVVWERTAASVPSEAVESAKLRAEGNKISLKVIPSPFATQEETLTLNKMSKELNNVIAIDGENMAVALVEKGNKKLLRIIDKRKGNVEEGEVVEIKNEEGGIKVKVRDENGSEREHLIKIDVTSSGAPVLRVDGKDGGVVKTVQTPEKFLFYDPEKGWQLINGILAPLAEAFKKGIQVSFSGGVGVARPSNVVINYPKERGGFSLPFTGPFLLLLPVGFALIYAIAQGGRQGHVS